MNLLKEFGDYVEKEQLFGSEHKLLLAVSGGSDSMVLLHLLRAAHFRVEVAHVNYQLRGDDSFLDEKFVSEYCKEHAIPFHLKRFNTKEYALSVGKGIQESARILRYTWFESLKNEFQFDYILTAHHANDQAETTLHHFIRGAGTKGLIGMVQNHGSIRRPLLFATKQQLLDYSRENAISYREDASNLKEEYTRNFIRKNILPAIQKIQEGFVENSLHNGKLMQASWHYFQVQMEALKKKYMTHQGAETIIQLETLLHEPYPEFVLFEFIQVFGFNFAQCKGIIASFQEQHIGALYFANANQLLINRTEIIIKPTNEVQVNINILSLPFQFIYEGSEYIFEETIFEGFEENTWWLDLDKLMLPLQLRNPIAGDRFKPLGLPHQQKLSDYFVNKKINRFDKSTALVLCIEERIAALLPHQVSDDFKLRDTTTRFLKISIKK